MEENNNIFRMSKQCISLLLRSSTDTCQQPPISCSPRSPLSQPVPKPRELSTCCVPTRRPVTLILLQLAKVPDHGEASRVFIETMPSYRYMANVGFVVVMLGGRRPSSRRCRIRSLHFHKRRHTAVSMVVQTSWISLLKASQAITICSIFQHPES